MNYEMRADGTLHIEGYVNAVERDSREVVTPDGVVVEQIAAGTFRAAIDKADNVDVLINHDEGRKVASTVQGNASLHEDNIGLRASVDITDAEVINEARATGVKGWSFGFVPIKRTLEKRAQGVPRRRITELELREVTLVMGNMSPVYSGTSVEIRAEGVPVVEYRCSFDAEGDNACDTVPDVVCQVDAVSDAVSEEVRGEFDTSVLREYEMRALSAFETQAEIELRYNPYHDPRNGRFTTAGGGGGGGVLFVGKGQKGKGAYILNSQSMWDKDADEISTALSKAYEASQRAANYTVKDSPTMGKYVQLAVDFRKKLEKAEQLIERKKRQKSEPPKPKVKKEPPKWRRVAPGWYFGQNGIEIQNMGDYFNIVDKSGKILKEYKTLKEAKTFSFV